MEPMAVHPIFVGGDLWRLGSRRSRDQRRARDRDGRETAVIRRLRIPTLEPHGDVRVSHFPERAGCGFGLRSFQQGHRVCPKTSRNEEARLLKIERMARRKRARLIELVEEGLELPLDRRVGERRRRREPAIVAGIQKVGHDPAHAVRADALAHHLELVCGCLAGPRGARPNIFPCPGDVDKGATLQRAVTERVVEGDPLVKLDHDVFEGDLLQDAGLRGADLVVEERKGVLGVHTTYQSTKRDDVDTHARAQRPRLIDELEGTLHFDLDAGLFEGRVCHCPGCSRRGCGRSHDKGRRGASGARSGEHQDRGEGEFEHASSDAISRTARSGVQWVSLPPGLVARGAGSHAATSESQAWPSSLIVPSEDKMRSQRRWFSSARRVTSAMNALRLWRPKRWSIALTSSSSSVIRSRTKPAYRSYGRGLSSSHPQPIDRQSCERYVAWRGRQSIISIPTVVRITAASTNAICPSAASSSRSPVPISLPQQIGCRLCYRVRLRAYARVSAFSTSASAFRPSLGQ